MSLESLLHVDLSAGYGPTNVITRAAFDLHPGESLGLIGTSGAGKSTLVLALLGLLPWRGGYARGTVLFEGSNLLTMPEREARRLRGKRFALIPQSPLTALNGALSLRAHFVEAWRAHQRWDPKPFLSRVGELFEQMHLPSGPEFLARRPSEISIGQAQRVLIALSLLHRPSLLIADEPTSALDPVTQSEVLQLLHRLHREHGTALLYISHDLLSVLQLCERVVVLHGGHTVESLLVQEVDQRAEHEATRALLRALPVPASVLLQHAAGKPLRP